MTEQILRQIELAGYRVTGWRDSVGDDQDGPLTVTALSTTTGQRHTVTVQTRGADGQAEALDQLAELVGVARANQ
jgi:hypothetical protein